MTNTSKWLAALLAGQVGLAVALIAFSSDYAAFEATEPLVSFDAAKIDRVTIHDEDGVVELAKLDDNWSIPDLASFPADGVKLDRMVERLAELKRGWPVAESSAAAERFNVGEEAFERKIELASGDDVVASLFLGSSPTYRRVHARAADSDEVYNVAFSTFDAPAATKDWIVKDLLTVTRDDIASITVADVTLNRDDDEFVLVDLTEDEALDRNALNRIVNAALEISYDDVRPQSLDASSEAALEVVLTTNEGDELRYAFVEDPDNDARFVFTRSDQTHAFSVFKSRVSPLSDAKRADLIVSEASDLSEDNDS